MSALERKARIRAMGFLYKKFGEPNMCIYCGDPADTQDHVPSLEAAYILGREELERIGAQLLLVPACRECNCTLGDRFLVTLSERAAFLAERYAKKYRRARKSEVFSPDEIEEFGDVMLTYIQNSSQRKCWIEKRLDTLHAIYGEAA